VGGGAFSVLRERKPGGLLLAGVTCCFSVSRVKCWLFFGFAAETFETFETFRDFLRLLAQGTWDNKTRQQDKTMISYNII
jgi:hypothetical protein